ncbi:unnamed protein product [Lactuca saligna]|uniref:Uncharacterized protein n=1 Tax=Lactuca saligna TaxID=75948 RepID=A0AA35VMX5_LACSI|nr:unnamed protein product [Lactuca saligna]
MSVKFKLHHQPSPTTGSPPSSAYHRSSSSFTYMGFKKWFKAQHNNSYRRRDENDPGIKCYLVDPLGSSLFNNVTRVVMYTREDAKGKRLKNPFDTVTEGIGINTFTENFKMTQLDGEF